MNQQSTKIVRLIHYYWYYKVSVTGLCWLRDLSKRGVSVNFSVRCILKHKSFIDMKVTRGNRYTTVSDTPAC